MDELPNEPAIRDRVTLEIGDGPRTVVDRATIANVTTEEIWVVVGKAAGDRLEAGSAVRIVVVRPQDGSLAAETSVRRQIGNSGRLVALRRPDDWRLTRAGLMGGQGWRFRPICATTPKIRSCRREPRISVWAASNASPTCLSRSAVSSTCR